MEQKKDKDFNIKENIFNSRKFGDFVINIPLKVEEFLIKNEPSTMKFINGIVLLEYDLRKKVDSDDDFNFEV